VSDDARDEFFSEGRTSGFEGTIELADGGYEQYLFDVHDPLLARYRGMRYDQYSRERTSPSFVQDLLAAWEQLYQEPFRGVTVDGRAIDDLYQLPVEGSSSSALRMAAEVVLDTLTAGERERFRYSIDAREWRAWSNPEFVIHSVGVRLEDVSEAAVAAVYELLRASLSPAGFELVRELMDLNGYLGELTELPTIMSPLSYSVALFGMPSDTDPWGWQLYGHHVAINFVAVGGRHVIAPQFLGAEPAASIDGRPVAFAARVGTALELAASLTASQREEAVVWESVLDSSMPADRLHPADERHVAGAFRDNRVVAYEGLASFTDSQWALLRDILEDFLILQTDHQRDATLADVDAHRSETHLAWYGATDGTQPFYLRIQSPVILAELDHHAGVWLTNQLPARFHVHTTLRLPNGNDYGRKYITQWRLRHGQTVDDERWSDA
jgi:Protein of unknown function (DUF3500)